MSVVVLGDTQAVAVAGYVAAVSGLRVHLVRDGRTAITDVGMDGALVTVDVVASSELPSGRLDAVIVVAESRRLAELLRPIAVRLSGVPVLLAPGGFAGALRVLDWFHEWGLRPPQVAEATGFPVGGQVVDHCLTVRSIKHKLPMASVDESATRRLHDIFVQLLPQLIPSDLMTTSLSNTNHMIHPGVVLLNASRVDNAEPFAFYRSGISPALGKLLEAVDDERMTLASRLGARSRSVRDWMNDFYEPEGMTGPTVVDCLSSFTPFADVPAPVALDYRYLVDDVPFGVAQWSVLADHLGIDVPHVDALLTLLRALVPDLDLAPDVQAAQLFRQFLASTQGVTA